jgi:tungstate transport system ATP-binding protein
MPAAIELQGISKIYGNNTVLKDISLQIPEGEVFSLLGPNGSGKTTLLRIMAGIEKPTSGELRFKGAKIENGNVSSLRLKTTMVFQKTALFNANVYKNVAYGLKIRGLSKQETDNMVKESLMTVKLEGFEKRPAKRLSGGEQQRVALARALALATEVLLLDEPTANIDPKTASIIEDVLSLVNRDKKTTIVIATHNMFQAETLAKRAALLLEGKIVKVGAPQEIFTLPPNLLANYLRLENVFSGVSKATGEGTSLVDVGEGLQIEIAFERNGQVTVFVRPEDIIVSSNPIVSSARNSFEGRIVEISDLDKIVKLKVKAGRDFTVQITKRSFNDMQLNIDSKIFLAFKASSVQMV